MIVKGHYRRHSRVLILDSKDLDREREFIMKSVDTFLRILSEYAKEMDRVKWEYVWRFLNDEWLIIFLAR